MSERCEDLISRRKAITEFSCCELTPDGGIDANYAIDFLKHLPSVQPEPCEDAVSRKAAIKCCTFGRTSLGLIDELRRLPPVTPKQQWIPCSEMEPKESGYYLCTHGGTGIVSTDYYTTREQAKELFTDPEDEYLDLEEYMGWTSKNVIAWMPLPESYKAERREDD